MTKMHQYLALVTILSISFHETLSATTELCNNDTAALGDIASSDAILAEFDFQKADCDVGLQNGLVIACDLIDTDRSAECVAKGGQARLVTQETNCDILGLSVINMPLCFGLRCDIDNIIIAAEEKIQLDFADILGVLPIDFNVDVDTCTHDMTAQAATPSSDDVDASTVDSGGSRTFAEPFICFFLMAIAPLVLMIV